MLTKELWENIYIVNSAISVFAMVVMTPITLALDILFLPLEIIALIIYKLFVE